MMVGHPVDGRWFKPDSDGPALRARGDSSGFPAPEPSAVDESTWDSPANGQPAWFERPFAGADTVPGPSAVGRSLYRLFRSYVSARAVVGLLLALLHLGLALAGSLPRLAALIISVAYAAQAVAVALWLLGVQRPRAPLGLPGGRRVLLTVGADVIAFLGLVLIDSRASFNFGALLVLPVLMAGVVLPRRSALATASAVTLALLAEAWWTSVQAPSGPSPWLAAGLAGMGLFAMAWVSGELAARLLREERRALDSQERARQQASLNRLVIEEMGEGVLVLNRQRRILAANPAAQSLLQWPAPFEVTSSRTVPEAPWAFLLDAVERAHADGGWPAAGRELSWSSGVAAGRKLRVRIRFTRLGTGLPSAEAERAAEDLCVLLLEDERAVQARVQQEKLAAMGRVSAGMAHEIRNPLAAIAQATELLSEDRLGGAQQRLVSIMSENVQRLRRLVDDVLDALPTGPAEGRPVEAVGLIRSMVLDWSTIARVPASVLDMRMPAVGVQVLFDPEHLRRILINLLENALRHSTAGVGSVRVGLVPASEREAVLTISNDGPPVPAEVEIHMFEPFFSTRSRGSGLGLFLCKELCERHGATISLAQRAARDEHRTAFEVRLRRPGASTLPGVGS